MAIYKNVFLHSDIGITVNNSTDKEHELPSGADDFELLIGSLNEVLEDMYGCQIVYDRAKKSEEHLYHPIPKGKTLFDGFAIFVFEKEEENDDGKD